MLKHRGPGSQSGTRGCKPPGPATPELPLGRCRARSSCVHTLAQLQPLNARRAVSPHFTGRQPEAQSLSNSPKRASRQGELGPRRRGLTTHTCCSSVDVAGHASRSGVKEDPVLSMPCSETRSCLDC